MHDEHPLSESVDYVIRDHVPEGCHHSHILRIASLTQLLVQLFPHGRIICPEVLKDRELVLLQVGVQRGQRGPRLLERGTDELDGREIIGFLQLR
jgi:hypothetical protein